MWLCYGLAVAVLLTGCACGTEIPKDEGDSHTFNVISFPNQVDTCGLKTPSGTELIFSPGDETNSTDKYVIEPGNSMALCSVTLKNIDKNDQGIWEIYYAYNNELGRSEVFTITIIKRNESQESESNDSQTKSEENKEGDKEEEEHEEENITLLSQIDHFTRQAAIIDISLNKESFEEECYVRPPNGEMTKADVLHLDGVEVHSKSNYVSCRITIGPMTESLLGVWRLCGKSEANEEVRCRPVEISWNSRDGISNWYTMSNPRFDHPVHWGGSVNPGVAVVSGTILSCHVITPAGEDLVITTDVEYPHIEISLIAGRPLCSIVIKDIREGMTGDWVVYGRFRTTAGQEEERLPMSFFLYNENTPYEQAYNVTYLEAQQHLVRLGTELSLAVSEHTGTVEDCIYITPLGERFNLDSAPSNALTGVSFKTASTGASCEVVLSSITNDKVGEWQIFGKFRNDNLFNERRQSFSIIKEDPENPLEETIERVIETMSEEIIITDMDTTHRIIIATVTFIEIESCHLITPEGKQYAFISGFDLSGVEIINQNGVECGVSLTLSNENMIGKWTLMARGTRLGDPIERRQPFTIRVEENFVIQNYITIMEGADLHLHLDTAIVNGETCKIYGPDGDEYTNAEHDPVYTYRCGYIIRTVDQRHHGKWIIEYGEAIKRRGSVDVVVLDAKTIALDNMEWATGDSIDIFVPPFEAVYCKIEDSRGHILFDGFGQCHIVLNRVTAEHKGIWKLYVALEGTVLLQEYGFYVDVLDRDDIPLVQTRVEVDKPSVMLTCSLFLHHEVRNCKFRDPSGKILVAAQGVGQNGYLFNSSVTSYESGASSHDCTLHLINPSVQDLGIWRCAMDTLAGTYYGFLTVVCPHLMQDPVIAASVETKPVLKRVQDYHYLEGEPVTLSCTIPAQLRYCYFRNDIGTIYNVFPGMSSGTFSYVGAGLDAGECGIRFNSLAPKPLAPWSCHVGLAHNATEEQRAFMHVEIMEKMRVRHFWHQSLPVVVVEAIVYDAHPLDYCRFVKINGQGFMSDNVPSGYELQPTMQSGICTLHITDPNILDLHPWVVVAKIIGIEGEISRVTNENLMSVIITPNILGDIIFWLLIVFICLVPVMAASALVPKKNREWTYNRASRMRASLRTSWDNAFIKKPYLQAQGP